MVIRLISVGVLTNSDNFNFGVAQQMAQRISDCAGSFPEDVQSVDLNAIIMNFVFYHFVSFKADDRMNFANRYRIIPGSRFRFCTSLCPDFLLKNMRGETKDTHQVVSASPAHSIK